MQQITYILQPGLLHLAEAFPTDHNGESVRGHKVEFSGEYTSLKRMLRELALYLGKTNLENFKNWHVSEVEDGRFLLDVDFLVDHNEKEPTAERLNKWENGEAQLFNAHYYFEVRCRYMEVVSEQEILKALGITFI